MLTFDQKVDMICNKANGVIMYAKEILSQLNERNFHVDLNALPKKTNLADNPFRVITPKGLWMIMSATDNK